MPAYNTQPYKNVREVLREEYRALTPEGVEQVLAQTLGAGISLDDLEDFAGAVQKVGGTIAKAAPQAMPVLKAAAKGGLAGVSGGVPGIIVGATGGALSTLRAPSGTTQPQGQPPQFAPAAAPQPLGVNPAACQLFQLIFRPEFLQCLMAMMMSQIGATQVMAGGKPVPVTEFTNLARQLIEYAEMEYGRVASASENGTFHLQDPWGQPPVDPDDPQARAEALWQSLNENSLSGEEWGLAEVYEEVEPPELAGELYYEYHTPLYYSYLGEEPLDLEASLEELMDLMHSLHEANGDEG
jgi:hypothetical protein